MYPAAETPPGLVVYRFDAPLIFANTRTFRDEVRSLARTDPPPRWIVVAAEPMTDVDTTAGDMLEELDGELEAAGTELVFAEMKDAVRLKIQSYGLDWLRDREGFYPTVNAAVRAYRRLHVETAAPADDAHAEPSVGPADP
jgi:MFS superfamily sulfate permease-like transporter